ncbi:DNA cytosine methyltransferase, partial [Candidatus Methanarcanum hacksteinii]|uniref:DNA cytosine methyltransferase n=1 Tax=Candidatus Methanarcanum hacksteinii TaxID=2911857 RepID=UPI0037DC5768
VEWRVINAADYGFVQRRRRTFIFASRNDTDHYASLEDSDPRTILSSSGFFARGFPVDGPVKGGYREFSVCVEDYGTLVDVSDGFHEPIGNSGVMVEHHAFTADMVSDYDGPRAMLGSVIVPCSDERYYQDSSLDKWREMKGPKRIQRVNKKTGIEYMYSEGGIPFPDPLDRPGRTMLTSEGSKNRSSHLIEDPSTGRYRILTPVECERLNGFPDDWTDTMSERQRYFTMGNALVVGLIERMGKILVEIEGGSQITRLPRQRAMEDFQI